MTLSPEGVPTTLLHHVKHSQVLHEHVVLLTIQSADVPKIEEDHRVNVQSFGQGFYRLTALYGYMETPNIPRIMKLAAKAGMPVDPTKTSFYLGRETLLTTGTSKMARWRKNLFALMSRNAANPTTFFGIPPNRVVELGAQVKL
jgi:KUP system potassium uptake protein